MGVSHWGVCWHHLIDSRVVSVLSIIEDNSVPRLFFSFSASVFATAWCSLIDGPISISSFYIRIAVTSMSCPSERFIIVAIGASHLVNYASFFLFWNIYWPDSRAIDHYRKRSTRDDFDSTLRNQHSCPAASGPARLWYLGPYHSRRDNDWPSGYFGISLIYTAHRKTRWVSCCPQGPL